MLNTHRGKIIFLKTFVNTGGHDVVLNINEKSIKLEWNEYKNQQCIYGYTQNTIFICTIYKLTLMIYMVRPTSVQTLFNE